MFDISIQLLTDLCGIIPVFVVVVLIFNIISDLLFNK